MALQVPGLVVVAPEDLGPEGIAAPESAARSDGVLPADRFALLDAAWARHWRRREALHQARPERWPPPRLGHICIALDPDHVRPYLEPLHRTSWLLEASDLDPATSDPEFAAYLLAFAELMGLTGSVTGALAASVDWFEARSRAELDVFSRACAATPRRDGAAWRALGEASPRLAGQSLSDEGWTGLLSAFAGGANEALAAHRSTLGEPGGSEAEACVARLLAEPPPVLVVAGSRKLFDPARPDEDAALADVLRRATPAAVESIGEDWRRISAATARFRALVDPARFEHVTPALEPGGLVHLDPVRRVLVYDLEAPDLDRLCLPAQPLTREMLGARAIHEWAHLAAAGGAVRVPDDQRAEAAREAELLAERYRGIVARLPAGLAQATEGEVAQLGPDPGRTLAGISLARHADHAANLLATRVWLPNERETYLRNNVHPHHAGARPRPFLQLLARYAYEAQYPALLGVPDPVGWLIETTWFRAGYLATGALDEPAFRALCEHVGTLLARHRVDPDLLAVPPPPDVA